MMRLRTKPATAAGQDERYSASPRKILYFAYGSNMNPGQIRARCLSPEVVSVARLVDHRLAFFGSSTVWDGALETVEPSPGRDVWGVLYALSRLDADSLDAWQGARFDGTGVYFHYPVIVIDVLAQRHETLLYKKDMLGAPQKPSREYLEHIARGAKARGLPPRYIEHLRQFASQRASYPVPVPRRGEGYGLHNTSCADCGSLVAAPPGPPTEARAWLKMPQPPAWHRQAESQGATFMERSDYNHPHGPLRRKDRQIMDPAAIDAILREGTVMYLALSDNNIPFVVPVFYAYDGQALFFHSAKVGTKIRILKNNPNVCFAVSLDHGVISNTTACDFEARHRTVIGYGLAAFVEGAADKAVVLDRIVARFTDKSFAYTPTALASTAIVRIDIASVKGKQHGMSGPASLLNALGQGSS